MNKTTTHSAEQPVYGSEEMVRPAPATTLPESMTAPEIAYRMVKDETYAETQPRLNLATFVTTYMDARHIRHSTLIATCSKTK